MLQDRPGAWLRVAAGLLCCCVASRLRVHFLLEFERATNLAMRPGGGRQNCQGGQGADVLLPVTSLIRPKETMLAFGIMAEPGTFQN